MPISIPTSDIRNNWSDIVNRAQYAGERFVVERHGSEVAAVVSVEDLQRLEHGAADADAGEVTTTPDKTSTRSSPRSSGKEYDLSDHLAALRKHVNASDDPQQDLATLIYQLIEGSDVDARRVLIATAYLCE